MKIYQLWGWNKGGDSFFEYLIPHNIIHVNLLDSWTKSSFLLPAVHVLFSPRSGSTCVEDALSVELTLDFWTTQGEIKWKICEMLLSSEKQNHKGCIWIDWPKVLELAVCFKPTLYEPLKPCWEVSYILSFPWSRWFVSSAVQHCTKHSWSTLAAPWNGTHLQWSFDFVSFSANFIHLCVCACQ